MSIFGDIRNEIVTRVAAFLLPGEQLYGATIVHAASALLCASLYL